MVDILAQNKQELCLGNQEDIASMSSAAAEASAADGVEDGELPEEGEITDDDDVQSAAVQSRDLASAREAPRSGRSKRRNFRP